MLLTVREARAGQELSVRTILDDHISSAFLADDIRLLIRDLDLLQILLGCLYRLIQIRVESSLRLFSSVPCRPPTGIQQRLHIRGKIHIHDARESILHNIIYDLAKLRHIQVLIFLNDIAAGNDRRDRRRIGAAVGRYQAPPESAQALPRYSAQAAG